MSNENSPIGIFDSGIGGLTVLKKILTALPNEGTLYLGDTARVPYGIRSSETVIRYALENSRFLISRDIKLLVIACNTASSVSLERLTSTIPVPVLGVIEPGAKAAVASTRNKKVGVIGTEATIRSDSYTKAIKTYDKDVTVFGISCPLFVPLVEEGRLDGKITELVAEEYLAPMKDKGVDTLVLGCTHYPLLKNIISSVMGDDVHLIDSAIEMAKEIHSLLSDMSLLRTDTGTLCHECYVTDSPERFTLVGERFLGKPITHIRKIELDTEV